MKVLMQARADLFDKPGGDLVQMQQTQAALQKLGVDVDISTDMTPSLVGYDLVHLYNISRIHDTLAQLQHAKHNHKAVVVSPIHHKLSEINRYEQLGRTGKMLMINKLLPTLSAREQTKAIYRLRDKRQTKAIFNMLKQGFVESQKQVLQQADAWIVLAESEAHQIKLDFGQTNDFHIAHNAVDPSFLAAKPVDVTSQYGIKDFILCVSRVEDRKNQIRLIEAAVNTGHQLVFVGGLNSNHADYIKQFQSLVQQHSSWVKYIGALPYQSLPNLYASAKLHVLPSWFEVVSLTALEAAAAGCKGVVADTGYMKEYLGSSVEYCDPASVESIRQAITTKLADHQPSSVDFSRYNWHNTAQQTKLAYDKVLSLR